MLNALRGTKEKRTPAQIITTVTAAAEAIAFTPENIKKSFKNCGLWPINFEKIETLDI